MLAATVPAWAQTIPARTSAPAAATRPAAGVRVAAPAATRETHDVTRLGGTTRFYRGSLATAAGLRRMSTDPAMGASMRRMLADAGVPGVSDALLTALGRVEENYVGVACMEARPEPGTVVECDVRPGESLEWMVFRPAGGAPAVVRNVRWAGRQPFRAYLVRVADRETSYTFLVPKDCGNLSLLSTQAMAPAASVAEVAAAPAPPPPPPAAIVAPPPPPEPAAATPPPADARALAVQAPPPPATRRVRVFADGLFGKERRVRPLDDDALVGTGEGEYAQCTPLVGLKVGVARRFDNNWELAGAVGVALSVVRDDDKVREHALFVEAEANRWIGRGFVGGGVGLWDLTRSDTLTPTAMVHVGLPVADQLRFPIYFLVEGRLFLDNADDIDNNYQFWGGIRVRF
ncbi:MAG: hypothetical protein IT181_27360 [Acidobacteria bacterium]|nr:hypothetical protein [Acidobacteriota bacterium]